MIKICPIKHVNFLDKYAISCYIPGTTTLTTGLRRLLGGYMKIKDYSVRVLNRKQNPAQETSEGYVYLEDGEQYTLLLRNFSDQDALASVELDGKRIASVKVPAKDKVMLDTTADSDKKFTFFSFANSENKELANGVSKKDRGSVRITFMPVEKDFQWKPVTVAGTIYYVPVYIWGWWTTAPRLAYPTWEVREESLPYYTCTVDAKGTITTATGGGFTTNMAAVENQGIQSTYCINTTQSEELSSGVTGLTGMAEHFPEDVQRNTEEFRKTFDEELAVTIRLRLVCKKQGKEKPEPLRGYGNPDPKPI